MSHREMAPPGADHSNHDRLLMARHAARDLDAAQARTAEALVARCTDCAALVADLLAISRTVATMTTPRRPRDFRISHEQAAAIRGSFFERLLRRFAMPGTAVLQPLAGAAVAIGLVLIVVGGSLPGTTPASMAYPSLGFTAGSLPSDGPGSEADAAATQTVHADASIGPEAPGAAPSKPPDTRLGLDAEDPPTAAAEGAAGGMKDGQTGSGRAAASAEDTRPTPDPAAQVTAQPSPDAAVAGADDDTSPGDSARAAGRPDPRGPPIVIAGALLAAAGLVVLIIRVLARRVVRDPALR